MEAVRLRWMGCVLGVLLVPEILRAEEAGEAAAKPPVLEEEEYVPPVSENLEALKKLSLSELLNVRIDVTSVSRRPERLTQAASAVQVITGEEIRRSGATSIPEALRLAPNLQVAQVNSSQWAISARGFNNVLANKLLVMIDGRTVYTPLFAGVFWDVQDTLLEDLDRIEVVSGPGGTLWGANAVNGVINIMTKNAKDTQGLFVEGGVGTQSVGFGGMRYGGVMAPGVYYRVYGKAFNRDNTVLLDGSNAKDDWDMGQGGFRVDWEPSAEDQVTFQGDYYNGRPNPNGASDPVVVMGGNVMARWKRTLSEESDFQVQFYYDRTRRDFNDDFKENLDTYDLDGQHRFHIGDRNEIIWGLGFRLMDDRVENLELIGFTPGHKTMLLYSAFIQDEITLIEDRLRLTLGSKFEHNDFTGFEFQPSGRLAWTPDERHTVWGAVSRGVRSPSRIDQDFYLNLAPGVPFFSPNPDFKSEELLAYEVGWRVQPHDTVSFSVATFYNVYDNIRSAEPGPPPFGLPVTIGNGVEGETYGVEFSTAYQVTDWWRVRGGYTLVKKHLSVKSSSDDLNDGTAESNDPQQQALIQSMMNLPGNIELDGVLRYVDELPDPSVAGYFGLDLRLAWKATPNVELSIVGQNLLDNSHPEFIPSSPAPREIERTVYGKVTLRW
jgi:iron complex outermembrane receptor protein